METLDENKVERSPILELEFTPESEEFVEATNEYKKIWNEDGTKILNTLDSISGLKFKQKKINVIVFEGVSFSRPMRLRASLSIDRKKAVLVHELGHRLLAGNGLDDIDDASRDLEDHKRLYLILYDVLKEIYGEDAAEDAVALDLSRQVFYYTEAWKYALSFTPEERKAEFGKLIDRYTKELVEAK